MNCAHYFIRKALYLGVLWRCLKCPFAYIRENGGTTWPGLRDSWWAAAGALTAVVVLVVAGMFAPAIAFEKPDIDLACDEAASAGELNGTIDYCSRAAAAYERMANGARGVEQSRILWMAAGCWAQVVVASDEADDRSSAVDAAQHARADLVRMLLSKYTPRLYRERAPAIFKHLEPFIETAA
jgi:hypothetical protein